MVAHRAAEENHLGVLRRGAGAGGLDAPLGQPIEQQQEEAPGAQHPQAHHGQAPAGQAEALQLLEDQGWVRRSKTDAHKRHGGEEVGFDVGV